jgi:uncharacterized C2H2 Zn-finger protein
MDLLGKQLVTAPSDEFFFILTLSTIEENMPLDPDSEENDGYDSTPLAESPESTGGVTVYGRTTKPSPMADDTDEGIETWGLLCSESKNVMCVLCGKILYEMKGFRRHFDDTHADPEKCPECDVIFVGKRKLKAHLRRVHNMEAFP